METNDTFEENQEPVASSDSGDTVVVYALTDEQYTTITDSLTNIKTSLEDIKSSNSAIASDSGTSDLLSKLQGISADVSQIKTAQSNAETLQDIPEDYYSVMSDLESQQTFFLSLIFGACICYLFVCNFIRK